MHAKNKINFCFKTTIAWLAFVFILSFPFLLGSDFEHQFNAHYYYGLALFIVAAGYFWGYRREFFKSPTFYCFLLFLAFEIARALLAYFVLSKGNVGDEKSLLMNYLKAPKFWGSYFGIFCVSYYVFNCRKWVVRLAQALGWVCFLLAINIIPPLLIHGSLGYLMESGKKVFFYPAVYFHPWISKYLIGHYAHPNWTGDVIAFGFFTVLGLTTYGIYDLFQKDKRSEEKQRSGRINILLLNVNICLVTAVAIFLIFSRGSILSFALGLAIFFGFVLLKYPSKKFFLGFVLLGGGMLTFLAWAGNLGDAWKEIQTLNKEVSALEKDPGKEIYKSNSAYTNREGWSRSLKIYKDYPFLGVGTNGYQSVSKKYLTSEAWARYTLSDYQAMCHYLQVLSEEGKGAFIYCLFILVGCIEIFIRLLKTNSRFQFFVALGFFSFVCMILFHAAFNHLMQRYAMSMMVYAAFGVCFGILHKDFQHEDKNSKKSTPSKILND